MKLYSLYNQLVSTNICMTVCTYAYILVYIRMYYNMPVYCGFHCLPHSSFAFISHSSFLLFFWQTRAWGDRHKCWHANRHTHGQRALRRPWPPQVAIWCLERWCYPGQPHGKRRRCGVSLPTPLSVFFLSLLLLLLLQESTQNTQDVIMAI